MGLQEWSSEGVCKRALVNNGPVLTTPLLTALLTIPSGRNMMDDVVELEPNLVELGSESVDFGPKLADLGLMLAQFQSEPGPTWSNQGLTRPKPGQVGQNSSQIQPELATPPNVADIGRISAPHQPRSSSVGQNWPTPGQLGPEFAKFGPSSAQLQPIPVQIWPSSFEIAPSLAQDCQTPDNRATSEGCLQKRGSKSKC